MQHKAVIVLGTFSLIIGAVAHGAENGEALFKAKCAGCHGSGGEGERP
jgi:mono/diheme cytochrome c family protein